MRVPAVPPEVVHMLSETGAAGQARGPQITRVIWRLSLPQIREKKKRHVFHLRQKVRRDEGAPERCLDRAPERRGNDTKGRKAPAAAGDAAGGGGPDRRVRQGRSGGEARRVSPPARAAQAEE